MPEMICGRHEQRHGLCPVCGAYPEEPCPLDDASTQELLERQGVSAGQAGVCNPDDGVCESCQ